MANFTHYITGEHFELYAKPVKLHTQKGQQLWQNYIKSQDVHLNDVYYTMSEEKKTAYNSIETLFMRTQDAVRLRICTHNTFNFTMGFCYANTEEDGYVHFYLLYFTRDNTYIVEITPYMYGNLNVLF